MLKNYEKALCKQLIMLNGFPRGSMQHQLHKEMKQLVASEMKTPIWWIFHNSPPNGFEWLAVNLERLQDPDFVDFANYLRTNPHDPQQPIAFLSEVINKFVYDNLEADKENKKLTEEDTYEFCRKLEKIIHWALEVPHRILIIRA